MNGVDEIHIVQSQADLNTEHEWMKVMGIDNTKFKFFVLFRKRKKKEVHLPLCQPIPVVSVTFLEQIHIQDCPQGHRNFHS